MHPRLSFVAEKAVDARAKAGYRRCVGSSLITSATFKQVHSLILNHLILLRLNRPLAGDIAATEWFTAVGCDLAVGRDHAFVVGEAVDERFGDRHAKSQRVFSLKGRDDGRDVAINLRILGNFNEAVGGQNGQGLAVGVRPDVFTDNVVFSGGVQSGPS